MARRPTADRRRHRGEADQRRRAARSPADDLLEDAQWLRSKLRGNVIHLNVVKNAGDYSGESVEQTELAAGSREWRDTMGTIGVTSSKSVELARLEAEQAGAGEVTGLLEQLMQSLHADRAVRDQQAADEGP